MRKFADFVGIFLVVGLPVLAAISCTQTTRQCDIIMPPPQYDHAPAVSVRLRYVDYGQIGAECQRMGAKPNRESCSAREPVLGWIIVLPIVDGVRVTRVMKECREDHELGHVNGWPETHDGGVYV